MADTPQKTPSQSGTLQLADEERQPCEVWTRVMGYHRPVVSFNVGKQGEHKQRRYFSEKRGKLHS